MPDAARGSARSMAGAWGRANPRRAGAARIRPSAPPDGDAQSLQWRAGHRQGPRRGLPVTRPTGLSYPVRTRVPDSGPEPSGAAASHAARPRRAPLARQRPTRHDAAIRGARRARRRPTSSNAGLALLAEKRIRRGVHRSASELENAIRRFIAVHDERPKPFVRTRTADQIISCRRAVLSAGRRLGTLRLPWPARRSHQGRRQSERPLDRTPALSCRSATRARARAFQTRAQDTSWSSPRFSPPT